MKEVEAAVCRYSTKQVFLAILQNSQDTVSFLINLQARDRCFPVNFGKFLRTPFFTEHLRLLLRKEKASMH